MWRNAIQSNHTLDGEALLVLAGEEHEDAAEGAGEGGQIGRGAGKVNDGVNDAAKELLPVRGRELSVRIVVVITLWK